jgi:hypothetical protein
VLHMLVSDLLGQGQHVVGILDVCHAFDGTMASVRHMHLISFEKVYHKILDTQELAV